MGARAGCWRKGRRVLRHDHAIESVHGWRRGGLGAVVGPSDDATSAGLIRRNREPSLIGHVVLPLHSVGQTGLALPTDANAIGDSSESGYGNLRIRVGNGVRDKKIAQILSGAGAVQE